MNDHGRPVSSRAFTLVEVVLAIGCLSISIIALESAYLSAMRLDDINKQTSVALQSARRAIEEIPQANFSTVFLRFNSDPADDPGGVGTAPGSLYPALNDYWTAHNLSTSPGSCFPVRAMTGRLANGFEVPGLGTQFAIGRIEFPNYNAADTLRLIRVRVVWVAPQEASSAPDGRTQVEIVTLMTQRSP